MRIYIGLILLQYVIMFANCSCSQQDTCDDCASFTACYWCDSSSKCEDYYGAKFSDLLCPNKWIQHKSLCPAGNSKVNEILDMLKHSQSSAKTVDGSEKTSGDNQDLKELLHKLLLLKLLRKIKNEGSSSLTAEDRQMLSQLTNLNVGAAPTTTTTTTKAPNGDVSNEIKQLLSILQNQESNDKTTKVVPITIKALVKPTSITKDTTLSKANVKSSNVSTVKPTENILNLLKKIDEQNAGVVYEEHKTESLSAPSHIKKNTNKSQSTQSPSLTTKVSIATSKSIKHLINFCGLYEEVNLCNSDHNCTWCNTRDTCIRRSGDDYQSCVEAKDQMIDKKYGLDKCLVLKHCKQCVQNNKCYWCDVSKSCHTYPFFGYVPDSCGGDWYVKQCDVQLAVIIIVLPLIIILLAMVTFYFCLKYCYYRRKVLRVPLFEKPGVFDYRKDKKVYYVNPEDESSDTEMAAEKIRKKYRLPVEREPLIDPNS